MNDGTKVRQFDSEPDTPTADPVESSREVPVSVEPVAKDPSLEDSVSAGPVAEESGPEGASPEMPTSEEPVSAESTSEEPESAEPVSASAGTTATKGKPPVLVALLVVLLLTVVGSVAAVARAQVLRILDLNRQIDTVNAQVRDTERADKAARETLERAFATEDFPARFAAVKKADQAVSDAFGGYSRGTHEYESVRQAEMACYELVDAYQKASANYPDTMFTSAAPARVDLEAPATDCGRALVTFG